MAEKLVWKPCALLNPVPVVMVSCGNMDTANIITVGWAGTICTIPPMLSISMRKSRYSYELITESRHFVVNLVTQNLVKAADWCGVKSGRDFNKFAHTGLTPIKAGTSDCPMISESPVNIECTVSNVLELGSHDLFVSKVDAVNVSKELVDESTGALHLERANLAAYCHGQYFTLGNQIGTFGFTVRKKKNKKK